MILRKSKIKLIGLELVNKIPERLIKLCINLILIKFIKIYNIYFTIKVYINLKKTNEGDRVYLEVQYNKRICFKIFLSL